MEIKNTKNRLFYLPVAFLIVIFFNSTSFSFAEEEAIQLSTETEDLSLTDDINIARAQVSKFPDNAEAHFNLAIALSRTSLVEEAVKELHTTKKLIRKQNDLSVIDKKIKEYEQMLKNDPDAHNIRYRLAFSYYLKAYFIEQEKERQKKELEKIHMMSLSKEERQKLRAIKELEEEKNKKKSLNVGLNIFDSDKLQVKDADPDVKKNLSTSMDYFKEILKKNPSDIWAKVYYAFILAEQLNEYEKAKNLWLEAKKQDPNNPAPHFFIGEMLIKEGYLKEGITEISQALLLRSQGY